jgi:hypothetical protein
MVYIFVVDSLETARVACACFVGRLSYHLQPNGCVAATGEQRILILYGQLNPRTQLNLKK